MSSNRRGPWSHSEDSYLMTLVQTHGPLNWVRIAQTLGSRTPKQCRERYHQNLKPSLNHDPITQEEGTEIERLVKDIGKRWAEIARRLHGRSDNAVKNWWNGSQNRRKRQDRRRIVESDLTFNNRYPRSAISMAPIRSPMARQRQLPSPPPWRDVPLPSPCSSEPADSDLGSNYTTSPVRVSRSLHRPVELPPLRRLPSSSELSKPLPGFSSLPTGVVSFSRADGSHPQASLTGTQHQLLTAPNSPSLSIDIVISRQPNNRQVPQPPLSADRDMRMNVSSLLE